MVESGRVPGKGRIRTSIDNLRRGVLEKRSNLCEYRKMVESEPVPGKGTIRPSIDNLRP